MLFFSTNPICILQNHRGNAPSKNKIYAFFCFRACVICDYSHVCVFYFVIMQCLFVCLIDAINENIAMFLKISCYFQMTHENKIYDIPNNVTQQKGKSNPRKMIKIWAEKEMRNYKRIYEANIPCPRPIMVKSNILLMQFLGKDGWPSPRLRDVTLPPKRQREAYIQCLRIMRHMFHRCKLVHGDLSEYNLLWHDNRVYVIDVSQSVEHDHPSALDFLRADCRNVNDFFRKNGDLPVMSTRQLFEFVTDVSIGVEEWEEDEALDRIMESVEETTMRLSSASGVDRSKEEQKEMVNDSVFMNSFIPRSLNQVAEQDLERVRDGHVEDTYAKAIGALTPAIHVEENDSHPPQPLGEGSGMASLKRKDSNDDDVRQVQFKHDEDEMKENDDHFDGETDDEDDENYDEDGNYIKVPMTPEQVKAAKEAKRASNKLNKKAVKEAQAEKRLTKIKKKDKKRAINKCKAGNKNRK